MNQTANRWVLFLVGIQCLAIGIVCNTRTTLGAAAFTSVFTSSPRFTTSVWEQLPFSYILF